MEEGAGESERVGREREREWERESGVWVKRWSEVGVVGVRRRGGVERNRGAARRRRGEWWKGRGGRGEGGRRRVASRQFAVSARDARTFYDFV